MKKKSPITVDLPTEAAQEILGIFERYTNEYPMYSFPTVKEIAKIIRRKFDEMLDEYLWSQRDD